MLKNPSYRQNHGTDLGGGMCPDVLPRLIDNPVGEFGSKHTANESTEENLIKGVPAAPGGCRGSGRCHSNF